MHLSVLSADQEPVRLALAQGQTGGVDLEGGGVQVEDVLGLGHHFQGPKADSPVVATTLNNMLDSVIEC